MVDVTCENFSSVLPVFRETLQKCAFVALDCEFTALNVTAEGKSSLFDTLEDRYVKLCGSAKKGIVSQLGISLFSFDHNTMSYVAHPYNFFVCPKPFFHLDEAFVTTASSLDFLARSDFDFNKWLRLGIGYMNATQESRLRQELESGALSRATERNLSFRDEDRIRDICSEVAQWLQQDQSGEDKTFNCGAISSYVLHQEIRTRFPSLWSFSGSKDGNTITVRKVTAAERLSLATQDSALDEQLIEHLLGISSAVRAISETRKPIVGHNCFADLVMIYEQFVDFLPRSYTEFKRRLNAFFPEVYDTKFVGYELRRVLETQDSSLLSNLADNLASTNLEDLHSALNSKECLSTVMHSPKVTLAEGFERYASEKRLHEAGFDAFITGICFIRCAHIASATNYISLHSMRRLNFAEHLSCLCLYKNRINVGRAQAQFMNLSSDDPKTTRPRFLYFRSRDANVALYPHLLAERLSRFGSVDVRSVSSNQAVVAVASFKVARDIFSAFSSDESIHVSKYKPWKGTLIWSGGIVIAATMISSFILMNKK